MDSRVSVARVGGFQREQHNTLILRELVGCCHGIACASHAPKNCPDDANVVILRIMSPSAEEMLMLMVAAAQASELIQHVGAIAHEAGRLLDELHPAIVCATLSIELALIAASHIDLWSFHEPANAID